MKNYTVHYTLSMRISERIQARDKAEAKKILVVRLAAAPIIIGDACYEVKRVVVKP
jgi:hypothetical protein